MIEITDKEFKKLAEYIKENYGINLKDEKKLLVTGRLQNILQEKGYHNFTQYFEALMADKSGESIISMINKITTNHTFFMREADHFDFFQNKVLPELKERITNRDIRIWCAASSTGEEPYTLAIILDEFFGKEKAGWDTRILATDLSESALETAIQGTYSNEKISVLSTWRVNNYFVKSDSQNWTVNDNIKYDVIFRKFNLMEKRFPFRKKFHVIFCRNVMIYFDDETRKNLIQKLYEALEEGGYLFVGHSESINRTQNKFEYVMPSVYRKNSKF
jgi:chemotaxis protein methyltransferase CheR